MSLAIVDYGSGNLRSAAKALERSARECGHGGAVEVTADAEAVRRAERIVLPGVGAFADCARGLAAVPGMAEALAEAVLRQGRPFLGICVGMQLLATRGLEHGSHPGLDWIAGDVVRLEPADRRLKVPHMGWNRLHLTQPEHPVLAGVPEGAFVYFVHSFHFRAARPEDVAAETDYGGPLAAVLARGNIVGTQFHPEKSQEVGLRLLANFLRWRP